MALRANDPDWHRGVLEESTNVEIIVGFVKGQESDLTLFVDTLEDIIVAQVLISVEYV